MKKEIKLIYYEEINKNNNIIQKSTSSINSESNNNQKNFLGKKRKNSKDKKVLSISRPITHCINRTNINHNINDNSICSICLHNISFEDRHFCHCGHIFHCTCINLWINDGKNDCPNCRQNINCINNLPVDRVIELDENENHNNYNNNNNINNNNHNNRENNHLSKRSLIFFLIIIYLLGNYCKWGYLFLCLLTVYFN